MSRLLRKIITCFLFCFCLWAGGLAWFISQIPQSPAPEDAKADAIVVLTGGSGRLEYGLKLLAEGKGKQLFISGIHNAITPQALLHQEKTPPTVAETAVVLGHRAENTIGNAEETVGWLYKQGYHSILLVTANYHMPRAIEEFAQTAPGIAIIPAPVFPDNFSLAGWWGNMTSRQLLLLEYHKYLASKLRHWLVSITHHP